MNMTFSEQFKSDVLLIWRTNGWVLMTVFAVFMLMPVADLPTLHSAKKPPLLMLGLLSMGGIASTLFGQSIFGAEYGFWTARFLTKEPLKDFFWKRLGTVMSIYAIVTAIFTGLTFAIRPELWQEAMGVFYVGMTLFGAASTFLFIIYSSAIRPIPFERMWLRINAFKAQVFKWQNLISTFVWAGIVMAVGYMFLVLEPQIWLIGVVVLSGLCCFFAVWSTEFLTRYLCRRRFNVMQELLQTDK